MANCTSKDCDLPVKARGLCSRHYYRWQVGRGKAEAPLRALNDWSNAQRLEGKWEISTTDFFEGTPCWIWKGAPDAQGYGKFKPQGAKAVYAHRAVYTELVGPIKPGFVLDHRCQNPICVHPLHLEPVTQRINVLRGKAPTALNARKTHCPQGHDLDEHGARQPNQPNSRRCLLCHNQQSLDRYYQNKAERLQQLPEEIANTERCRVMLQMLVCEVLNLGIEIQHLGQLMQVSRKAVREWREGQRVPFIPRRGKVLKQLRDIKARLEGEN